MFVHQIQQLRKSPTTKSASQICWKLRCQTRNGYNGEYTMGYPEWENKTRTETDLQNSCPRHVSSMAFHFLGRKKTIDGHGSLLMARTTYAEIDHILASKNWCLFDTSAVASSIWDHRLICACGDQIQLWAKKVAPSLLENKQVAYDENVCNRNHSPCEWLTKVDLPETTAAFLKT
ncbi:hypothetical protein KIN20_021723 [Parelaphostrongylus tenuis]|uniref:Uncharacterized protein n=1 Tax=Parelaphostrongylus tenuis TaxID=148309 RepID=A0AAD5QWC6_PARTN|nr:hypothetical protein KIN20_021723 [Parelaphostrongylus tenuis]